MAKTSSTVHLEDSTWDEIEKYRQQYNCGRNEAIERMFVERRLLLNINCKVNRVAENNLNNEVSIDEAEDKKELDTALSSAYDEMPE